MDNVCEICNKTFSNKYNLAKHKNKKFPCKKYEDLTCQRCKKDFKTKQGLDRHLNRKLQCKEKLSDLTELEKEKTKQEKEKTKQEELKLKQEELKLKRVEKERKNLKHQSITNINISVQVLNCFDNKNILPFNTSNAFLTKEEILEILHSTSPQESAEKMIRAHYLNNNKPENRNVICPNISKDDILLLDKDNIWQIDSFDKNKDKIKSIAFDASRNAYHLYRKVLDDNINLYYLGCPSISEPQLKLILNENSSILENAIENSL